jgi:hypothetical protein
MNYLQRTASFFSELSSSEKGYLKKFIKTRLPVWPAKKAEQAREIFARVDHNDLADAVYPPDVTKDVFALFITGLEEYHKNETTLARSYISQVEILLEKNLNTQAEKLLAKAKKMARKAGNYEMQYEIVEWQVAIHSLKPPTDKNMKLFEEYFSELEELLQRQSEHFNVTI